MTTIIDIALHRELLLIILTSLASFAFTIWPFNRDDADAQDSNHEELSDESSEDFLTQGVRLALQGNIDRAARRFKRAVDNDPNDAAAHYNLALAFDIKGKSADAKNHYTKAAELDPASLDAGINLGIILLDEGEIESAINEFKRAVKLSPEDFSAHFNLGYAYLKAELYREAVSSFREAIKSDPRNPETRFNLAIAFRKSGCSDLAENELREFLSLAGKRFPMHSNYAMNLHKDQNTDS